MSINSINSVNFKGYITAKLANSSNNLGLNTDKILKMEETKYKRTLVTYDRPEEKYYKGYGFKYTDESMKITVEADLDTMIKAYAAAKDSNIEIDLSKSSI